MSHLFNSFKNLAGSYIQKDSNESAGESSREMRFNLSSPPLGQSSKNTDEASSSSDFNQWLHAMKMVARLPGGMPPEFRRKLWLALSDKYLKSKNVDWEKEEIKCFSEQWREDDEELGIQIVKDLHRTGSSLCSGPAGTINQAKLKRILLGYARYNPEVGYCQGFNMLGALILQVMDKEEIESIKVMIYLIEGILPGGYFSGSLGGLQADMAVFRELMTSKLPRLAKHLQKLQGPVENAFEPPLTNVFTMQWFLTMFCTCLPMTCVLRVWDLVLIEGSDVLLRTALVLWSLLEERILNARTADDFYCKMGSFSSELLNGHLIDSNGLIEKVVELGPIPELQKLRDKHLYNISPFRDKKGLQLYYSDEEGDSDEDSRMAVATAWGLRLSRRGSAGLSQKSDGKDRIALDISLLKKQYDRLRERQRQAHIILTSAVARQGSNPNQSSIQMNQLLIGRSAIVTNNGRRLGPPQGAIPPARKPSLPTAKLSKPAQTKTLRRGETLHWRDTDLSKRRRGSLKWKDIKSDSSQSGQDERASQLIESAPSSRSSSSEPKSQRTSLKARQRSDSSSYSEDSDGNSSTSTSLCDEDDHEVGNVSSLEGSPFKKSKSSKKHSEVPHKKCIEDVQNSNDKHHRTDSQIPFIQLTTMDSPVMNANKTEIDSMEYTKEDSDTESNRLDYAGFVDEYSWPDINESTSSVPPEDITIDITSDEGDYLSLSNVITSTSQLSPIPDIATYINNSSISPLGTPISTFDYANLIVSIEESKKFDVNDEGVTNEYFERVNIVERPTKLDLLYSLNEEDSIRNAYKTQSSVTSPEPVLHKDLDLPKEKRSEDSSELLASASSAKNLNPSSEEFDRKMKVLLEYSNQSSLSFIAEAKHEISTGMFKGKEFDPLSLKYQPLVPVLSNTSLSADETSATDELVEHALSMSSSKKKATLKSSTKSVSSDGDTAPNYEPGITYEIKVQSICATFTSPSEGNLQESDQSEPCEDLDLKSNETPTESIDPVTSAVEKEMEEIPSLIPSTEDLEMRFKALEMNFSDRNKLSPTENDSEIESKTTAQNTLSETKTDSESNFSAHATLKSPITGLATTPDTVVVSFSTPSPIQQQHLNQVSNFSDQSHALPAGKEDADPNSQCQSDGVEDDHSSPSISKIGFVAELVPKQDSNREPSTVYMQEESNSDSLFYPHLVKDLQIEKDMSESRCTLGVSEMNESVVLEQVFDDDRPTVLPENNESGLVDEFKLEIRDSKPHVQITNSEAEVDEPIIEKEPKPYRSENDSNVGVDESVRLPGVSNSDGSIDLPTKDESGEPRKETGSDRYRCSIRTVSEADEFIVLEQTNEDIDVPFTDSNSKAADTKTSNSSVQSEIVKTKSIPTTADLEHRFRELERKLSSKSINLSSKSAPSQQDDLRALRQYTVVTKPSIVLPKSEDTTPTNTSDTPSLMQAEDQPPFIRKRIPSTEDLEIRFEALEIQKSLKSPTVLSPSQTKAEFSLASPEMDTASKRKSDIPSTENLENRFQAFEQRKLVEKSAQHETNSGISHPDCTISSSKDLETRYIALEQRKSVADNCTQAKNSKDEANILENKEPNNIPSALDLKAGFELLEHQNSVIDEVKKEKHNSPEIQISSESKCDVRNEKIVPTTQDLETRYEALEQQKASLKKGLESETSTESNRGQTTKGVPSTQDLETRFDALEQCKSISSDTKIPNATSNRNEQHFKKLPSTQDLETRFEALEQRKSATDGGIKNQSIVAEIKEQKPKLPTTHDLETRFNALEHQKSITDGCSKDKHFDSLQIVSKTEDLGVQKASKVPSTQDLETRFEALKHQKPAVAIEGGHAKLSKVPSTQDLEKRFAVMQIDAEKHKVAKASKHVIPSKTEAALMKVQTDDSEEIPDKHKRRDLYKVESQSDETLTASDQTSTEFETKVESRPTSCPEYSDPFDSNIVTTDRVLKIIEENSKILHRILKKTLADSGDLDAKDQAKKSYPGITDSLLALGNIFPRPDETISPSHIKSHAWIRPSITLRSDDNISDRLASIKSTIKSIDTLCEEKSFRKEKCQRYIDSLFARPTLKPAADSVSPSIKIDSFERKPSQDRTAKREQQKDISPRRRRDEDREEYESRVRRDKMPNSLDAPSDFSFSVANIDQVDSEVDRINQEKQVDTQIERPLSPYYGSGYDLNKRSITPVVYIPTKLEIRHTTVTSTFYDRYLTEKHIERTFPRSKKSPVSPTTTKSYLDIAKYSSTNLNDRSSKSAENSPSRRNNGGGLSPNYTISSPANRRSIISTLDVAQKDLQIRSCDNILLQLRSSTHNTDIVPSIMVYNPLPTKIRKPPELGISLGLYKDYGSDEASKS